MTRVKKAQMGTLFHTGRQKSGAQVSTKFGAQMSSCNSGKKAQMSCAPDTCTFNWHQNMIVH